MKHSTTDLGSLKSQFIDSRGAFNEVLGIHWAICQPQSVPPALPAATFRPSPPTSARTPSKECFRRCRYGQHPSRVVASRRPDTLRVGGAVTTRRVVQRRPTSRTPTCESGTTLRGCARAADVVRLRRHERRVRNMLPGEGNHPRASGRRE